MSAPAPKARAFQFGLGQCHEYQQLLAFRRGQGKGTKQKDCLAYDFKHDVVGHFDQTDIPHNRGLDDAKYVYTPTILHQLDQRNSQCVCVCVCLCNLLHVMGSHVKK